MHRLEQGCFLSVGITQHHTCFKGSFFMVFLYLKWFEFCIYFVFFFFYNWQVLGNMKKDPRSLMLVTVVKSLQRLGYIFKVIYFSLSYFHIVLPNFHRQSFNRFYDISIFYNFHNLLEVLMLMYT